MPELLSILDTTTGEVPVLRPVSTDAVTEYPVPVADFSLRRIELDGASVVIDVDGPTMVLATAGHVVVSGAGGEVRDVPVGTVAFATPDEGSLTISGRGEAFVASPGDPAAES